MNDAISTIALGVDTAPGLQHLKELRQAFAGLRGEMVEFNALKANPQAVTGGTSKAQSELATLGVELRNARNEITKHQDAMSAMSRSTVSTVETTAKAVVNAVQNQNRGVIESEASAAAATQRLHQETTKVVAQEAAKRVSQSQSFRNPNTGMTVSMKLPATENDLAAAKRASDANRVSLLEQARQYQTHLAGQRSAMDSFKRAEQQKLTEQTQQYRQHLLDQAKHAKEWNAIEKMLAEDAKEAKRVKGITETQQYQEHLARQRGYLSRHRELEKTFRDADKAAQKQSLLEQEQQYREHLMKVKAMTDAQRATQRGMIQNNNFNTDSLSGQVTTVRRAQGLVNNGQTALATELYGKDAVNAVGNYERMLAQLQATQQRGNASSREAAQNHRVVTAAMNDAHSAARGLAGGIGQLWLTWGNTVPLVAGAVIAGSLAKSLSMGTEVEFQLQFLRALANDMEREPIDFDKFIGITDGSMSTLKEAAEGMRALAQNGLDQRKALQALPDVLNLSVIGEMDVGSAALSATGIAQAFNMQANEIGKVGDIFSQVAASSNTSVRGMTESMKQASTAGDMFKVTIEETASAIGVLAQRNIIGSAAGTALTNSLKSLYEPTAEAKAAMDAVGLSTSDGAGNIKGYTELIDELRQKLSQMNEASRAVFLGTIADQRGSKALSAVTSDFEKYNEFLNEAKDSSGFMSAAVLQLEDTVHGSFRRMSNSVDGTFNKAFQQAEPTIRRVAEEIGEMAKADEVVNSLANLAIATARVTQTMVQNGDSILMAAAAYAGLRVVSGAASAMVVWRNSVAASTLANAANTVATTGASGAIGGAGIIAGGASVGMTRFAMAARMASASLGPLSLLIMAGYTAYELMGASTSRAENALNRANNTTDTAINFYDRQIDKLKELNKELSNNAELTKKAGVETSRSALMGELQKAEADVAKSVSRPATSMWGNWDANNRNAERDEALAVARRDEIAGKLAKLDAKEREFKIESNDNLRLTKRQNVARRLDDLDKMAGGKSDTFGDQGNDKTKAFIPELDALKVELAQADSDADAIALKAGEVGKKINGALNNFVKPDKGGARSAERDAYGAGQLQLDGELQRIKDMEKSALATNKTNLAVNEIGSLQSIANELAIVTKARRDELVVFEQKEAMAAAAENRKRNEQSIVNKKEGTERDILEADREAVRQRRELFSKWAEESLATESRNLRDRGELIRAFELEFNSKNGGEMTQIDNDLNDPRTNYAQKESLNGRKEHLTNEWNSGRQSAMFAQLEEQYEALVSGMEERLAEVATKASATNGFLSDVGAAAMADGIRDQTIPAANELLAKMSAIADGLGDPKLKGSVSKMGTDLVREAQRSSKAWIDAGKSIEKSLSDAFGKGGKAVGGVISALMRQKAEQKDLDDQVKRAQSDPKMDKTKLLEVQDAATIKSTEIQLASYGSIAGAAKGYFDEQSKGYAVMQAAEQTFRAFEIASAIHTHLTKSGLLTGFLGLFTTVKATEVAVEAGTVAPTIASESAKATAHGITGLAAALSLPYPANIPAFAITAAMLAAIGVAVSGAGGGGSKVNLSEERQKFNGTGKSYNTDDEKANAYDWELEKSESLARAMEALRENSDIELRYSSSQLLTLESINAGISGLVNTVSITSGIRGTRADEAALGVFATHSKLGFSSSSKTLLDSGIAFNNTNIGSIMGGSAVAQSYADMETKKKSFWGLSSSKKTNTEYQNLDGELAEQMSLIVGDMYTVVKNAAVAFGQDNATIEAALKNMSLSSAGMTRISLKGLSSDEVEKELQAVFGNLGDTMAKVAMPGLNAFQQAGEGYMSTIVRVSSGIEAAQYTMQKLGIAAADYNSIANKQGDVTTEIVRASLLQKEASGNVLSGIGQMVESFVGSAAEMAEAYTNLNDVRRTMIATGAKDSNVTADMVKGAGGVSNLASGMKDFLEEFFTEGERAAIKTGFLNEEFRKLNITMPASKDAFKELVEGLDRSTPAGQALYGALINLSGQFSELAGEAGGVDPALAKQRASINVLIDAAERWTDAAREGRTLLADIDAELAKGSGKVDNSKRIAELRQLMDTSTVSFEQQLDLAGQIKDLVLEKYEIEKKNAEDLIEFGRDLRDYVRDLSTGDKSPLTNKQKLEEAQKLYNQNLNDLNSTDEGVRDKARDSLQGRADTLLELAKTYYASSQGYTDIFGEVTKQLEAVGLDALNKGNAAEVTAKDQLQELKDLRAEVIGVNDAIDREMSAVTNQLAIQVRVLGEMSDDLGVISEVPEILRGLPAELAGLLGTLGVDGGGVNDTMEDSIKGLYRTLLNRKADDAGLQFWLDAANRGITIEQIREEMKKTNEYQVKVNGSHAGGLGYVPFDGYIAELHRGEEILTASQAEARRTDKAAMASTGSFSSNEKSEMAAEIRELKAAVERLTTGQREAAEVIARAVHSSSQANADAIVAGTQEAAASSSWGDRNKPGIK